MEMETHVMPGSPRPLRSSCLFWLARFPVSAHGPASWLPCHLICKKKTILIFKGKLNKQHNYVNIKGLLTSYKITGTCFCIHLSSHQFIAKNDWKSWPESLSHLGRMTWWSSLPRTETSRWLPSAESVTRVSDSVNSPNSHMYYRLQSGIGKKPETVTALSCEESWVWQSLRWKILTVIELLT